MASKWHPYRIGCSYWCQGCARDIKPKELVFESDRLAAVLCSDCVRELSTLLDIVLIEEAVASSDTDVAVSRLRACLLPPELKQG
jgi:hypothetical protein